MSRIYMEDASLYRDDVARLITLGSPHGGVNYPATAIYPIPLNTAIICILQPAVCQFTNPGMIGINLIYDTRAENVPYTLIGGTWSDVRSWAFWLSEGPNDTVVGRASAAGRYWPLGTAVDGDQVQRLQISSDHGGYFTGAIRYACIRRGLGLSGNCADADAPPDSLPLTDDPILSGHTQDLVGSVQEGQVVSHTVTVDTSEHTVFMLSWLDGTLVYTLTNPSGTLITPAYAAANPGIVSYTTATASGEQPAWAAYAFTQTLPGPWTLWVSGADTPPAGSSYHTSAWMETTRTLSAGANQELYQVGNTAVLTATLQSDGLGLAGATVQAILPRTDGITDTVTLTDIGAGNYQVSYPVPDAPGYVFGRVAATGNNSGTAFNRQTELVFAIASQAAQLTGSYAVRTPDLNTDSRYDALLVDMGVVATEPVTMSFSADLEPTGIAETLRAVTTTVLATGTQTVTLEFPGRDIHRARSSGPCTITNVLLHDLGLGGVLTQAIDNVHVTGLYDYRQFGLRGDVDNSCQVDLFDVMAVTMEWGVTTFNPDVDLDLDDRISVRDIMLVTSRWGETC